MNGHSGSGFGMAALQAKSPANRSPRGKKKAAGMTMDQRSEKLAPLVRLLAHYSGRPESRQRNTAIPAGYTYLAQFMIHDLTQHGDPLTDHESRDLELRDLRLGRLVLDSIYGGGPRLAPVLYETAFESEEYAEMGRRPIVRTRLRLGRLRSTGAQRNVGAEPALDLPRAGCPFAADSPEVARRLTPTWRGNLSDGGEPDDDEPQFKGMPDVLIADPRNDDNAVLSQIAVFFHLFHNWVVGRLETELKSKGDEQVSRQIRFLLARRIVAACFRSVIRDDLLPRLLCDRVRKAYAGRTDFPDGDGPEVSPEFSHGVGRFAHTMVGHSYRFSDSVAFNTVAIISQNSRRRPRDMPFTRTWVAPWANFFPIDGQAPVNLSRLIRPFYNEHLSMLGMFEDDLRRAGIETMGGLMMFDLLRSFQPGVKSLQELRETLDDKLFDKKALYADRSGKTARKAIADWLEARSKEAPKDRRMTKAEIAFVADDPPLSFYTCLEAELEQKGKCLGTLGSAVFAETVYPALQAAEDRDLTVTLPDGSGRKLGRLLDGLVPPEAQGDMGRLIAHVARQAEQDGTPAPVL